MSDSGDLISEIIYHNDDTVRSEIDYSFNPDRTICEKTMDHEILSLHWYDPDGNETEKEVYRYSDEIDRFTYMYE